MVIQVPSSDSVIWNLNDILIDVCFAMSNGDSILMDLLDEGPDLRTCGIYDYLEKCATKFNYPLCNISIKTSNIFEHHDAIRIDYHPTTMFVDNIIDKLSSITYDKDNLLSTFGIFIGRGNAPRLYLATLLMELSDNNIISYHHDIHNEFHNPHTSLNEVISFCNNNDVSKEAFFISKCPIRLDSEMVTYPISDKDSTEIYPYYSKFLIEVVCETYYSGTTFFPNEKTWRPIMLKTPFIVHGPKDYLKNLKKMGFKTFDRWWDEGYSEDPPEYSLKLIAEIIKKLQRKTQDELSQMYLEMKPILDHNYNTLVSLSKRDFYKIIS